MLRFAATQNCAAFPVPKIVISSSLKQMVGALSGMAAATHAPMLLAFVRTGRGTKQGSLEGRRVVEVSEKLLPGSLKISHMRIEQLKKKVLNFGV